MKIYVLTISDRDMRPKCDATTTALFRERGEAIAAMKRDIASAIANELVGETEIERHPEENYAVSIDGRLSWKIEERIVRTTETNNASRVVETPADAAALFRAALPKEQKEERVFVLPMDANGKALTKPILVSVGHEDSTAAIDAGAVFREALKAGAEEIILAHNHPSGDLTPSKADVAATKELKALDERLQTPILDHIILAPAKSAGTKDFISLAETSLL